MRQPRRKPARSSPKRAMLAKTRKVPINLSLRADLVERARALELNVSDVVESALERVIVEAEQARWQNENEAAMDYYNAFIEKHGLFSDTFRKF